MAVNPGHGLTLDGAFRVVRILDNDLTITEMRLHTTAKLGLWPEIHLAASLLSLRAMASKCAECYLSCLAQERTFARFHSMETLGSLVFVSAPKISGIYVSLVCRSSSVALSMLRA